MSYEITIKQTRQVKKLCGKEWRVVGKKEVERTFCDGGPKTRLDDVFDYTPEIEKMITEEVEILKQVVETLDLATVIKAVNGL